MTSSEDDSKSVSIPWADFARFVRQLSHDIRNQLNAAELQAALVGELTRDPELKPEIKRLRELVSQVATSLQKLSNSVAEPKPTTMPYSSGDFMSDIQAIVQRDYSAESNAIRWTFPPQNVTLKIDPPMMESAAMELLNNALRHDRAPGNITVSGSVEGESFLFRVAGAKSNETEPAAMFRPLAAMSHGHYSLGLRQVQAVTAAHNGTLLAHFDPSSRILTSTITLPCSTQVG